jgi:predicted DNA-binding transcriptional regulator AlpA
MTRAFNEGDPQSFMTAREVKIACGGVSDMCIWRWVQDPALEFPKPVYIRSRRYWRRADLFAWLASRPNTRAA